MRETHSPKFFHEAALVILPNGHEFFVDAVPPADASHLKLEDEHVGQLLCNVAFWLGYVGPGELRSDYELSGFNLP
jgi:hypothetical protein